MAYTVAPDSAAGTISRADADKDTKQPVVKYEEKFENTDTVEKIIVFDRTKDIALQVVANAQAWSLDVTSTAGEDNDDITDAAVPWVSLKSAITTDFHVGSGLSNRGIIAVRITSGTPAVPVALTDDFDIFAQQQSIDEIRV